MDAIQFSKETWESNNQRKKYDEQKKYDSWVLLIHNYSFNNQTEKIIIYFIQ